MPQSEINSIILEEVRELRKELKELRGQFTFLKGAGLGIAAFAGFVGSIVKHFMGSWH